MTAAGAAMTRAAAWLRAGRGGMFVLALLVLRWQPGSGTS